MKKAGIVLLIIGAASIVVQNTFYGYVDAEGVLHDSIFLPVGTIATLFGIGLFILSTINCLLKKSKKSIPIP